MGKALTVSSLLGDLELSGALQKALDGGDYFHYLFLDGYDPERQGELPKINAASRWQELVYTILTPKFLLFGFVMQV